MYQIHLMNQPNAKLMHLTPEKLAQLNLDPQNKVYEYEFDDNTTKPLCADEIAHAVRFIYMEAKALANTGCTDSQIEESILELENMKSFKKSHPKLFAMVCCSNPKEVDLHTITTLLDLKKRQEMGEQEEAILAKVEKAVIGGADKKRSIAKSD